MMRFSVKLTTLFLKRGILAFSYLLLMSFLFIDLAWSKKETVTFNEEEVLVVTVSQEGPIRISIKGDRLQDVMGLDESVNAEKDETHGLLYLRNLDKKQSLTLITEGGTVQDITLVPGKHGASVIVLKSKDDEETPSLKHPLQPSYRPAVLPVSAQTAFPPPPSFPEQVLAVIKQLYQGGGVDSLEEKGAFLERSTIYGLTAKPLRCLKAYGMRGEVYEVINTTETTLNLLEKDFYQGGDHALSIGKKQLESGEKTLLMVVRHG